MADRVVNFEEHKGKKGKGGEGGSEGGSGGSPHESIDWSWFDEMNKEFAMVCRNGTSDVMRETRDPNGVVLRQFIKIDAFMNMMANKKVLIDGRMVSHGVLWKGHPQRRSYWGVYFRPNDTSPRKDYLNLFHGFGLNPVEVADPQRFSYFTDHLFNNVCGRSEFLYVWLLAWLAHLVKTPDKSCKTAVVFRGQEGVGKSVIGRVMKRMLGDYQMNTSDPRYITGQFNAHLFDKLLVVVEEACFGDDAKTAGRLRELITGDDQMLERKGRDSELEPSFVRLMITGNADWVVPISTDDRRFAVFDVGTAHKEDSGYFSAMTEQLDDGGAEHLMRYLLDLETPQVDLRRPPRTDARAAQMIEGLRGARQWWYEALCRGSVEIGETEWKTEVLKNTAYQSYISEQETLKRYERSGQTKLGLELRKLCPGIRDGRGMRDVYDPKTGGTTMKNVTYWIFPLLNECRRAFEVMIDTPLAWPDG